MTVSEIEVIIARLEAQMGRAAGRERFGDREVVWNSASDLIERINYYKGLLAEASSTPRTRFIRMSTGSGY